MKKVLILTAISDNNKKANRLTNQDLKKQLSKRLKSNKIDIEIAHYNDFTYQAGSILKIWHIEKGYDLADFSAVIINLAGRYKILATTIAHYLASKKIPFTDTYLLSSEESKLLSSVIGTINKLPMPETIYAPLSYLQKYFQDKNSPIQYPVIIKDDSGTKGKNNYLVKNEKELIAAYRASSEKMLIAQNFIPNNGDLRILILNQKPAFCMLRKGGDKTHLNNTSQGGKAILVSTKELNKKIISDAKQIAKLENLQVAGVDIIINKDTKKHYILEINRAPQIYSGSLVDEKLDAYAEFIADFVNLYQDTSIQYK